MTIRNLFLVLTTLIFCLVGPISCAKTKQKKHASIIVKLYQAPTSAAKVIDKISPTRRFVPFYYKQGWAKVGVSRDGKVGWINLKQYRAAKRAYYREQMRSIFVQKTTGKNKTTVTAYVNGKKVDHAKAVKLYKRMAMHNHMARMHMWRMQQRMNRMMRRMSRGFNSDFGLGPNWSRFPTPMLQPIVIVVKSRS